MAELFENDLCKIVDTTMADVTFEQAREGLASLPPSRLRRSASW